jgi:hypothetical protein
MSAELLRDAEQTLRKEPKRRKVGGFDSKLEAARYEYHLERVKAGLIAAVLRQPMFDLPGGLRYRADLMLIGVEEFGGGHGITVEEVKGSRLGKNSRDSLTRCRVAAGLNPWARWLIVERERGGCWIEEEL